MPVSPTAGTAWVVGDAVGIRQELMQEFGWKVVNITADLYSHAQCNLLCTRLQQQLPSFLWIRLGGPHACSGNRRDVKRASSVCRLVNVQKDGGRRFLVDANSRCSTWNLSLVADCIGGQVRIDVPWCAFGIDMSASARFAANSALSTYASCQCQRQHPHLRSLPKHVTVAAEKEVLGKVVGLLLAQQHGQPESIPSGVTSAGEVNLKAWETEAVSERSEDRHVRFQFPTEQAEKAKQRRERLKAIGATVPTVTPKVKHVEQHVDDCGTDTTSILFGQSIFNAGDCEFDPSFQVLNFVYKKFVGRDVRRRDWSLPSGVAIMEIFGGDATTSRLLVRTYGMKSGPNLEKECGFDLSTTEGIAAL